MATKDWKKIGFASAGPTWEKGNMKVIVDNRGNKWFVETQKWSPTSGRSDSILKHNLSKSEALMFAKNYMRNN